MNRYASSFFCFLLFLGSPLADALAAESEEKKEPASPPSDARKSDGPDWMVVITPTGGWLRNETTFHFAVPKGRDASGQLMFEEHKATLEDDGWGLGFTLMGFYKWISLTNVFFYFPRVNESVLVGNITYLAGTIPTGTFVEPYLGLGFVLVDTDTDYKDFHYSLRQDLYDRPAVGYADFPKMSIDNLVVAPFPKVGLKFQLPIQHWYVTPFYSYMYEKVDIRSRSSGGDVQVFYEGDKEAGLPPQLEHHVPSFDNPLVKEYHSNMAGFDFFLDYHYFLQLRGKLYYNATYDLWTLRAIGSFLFSKYVGISVYLEYSEKITLTNLYVLVGPAFILSPPGFMDEMMRRRKMKMRKE